MLQLNPRFFVFRFGGTREPSPAVFPIMAILPRPFLSGDLPFAICLNKIPEANSLNCAGRRVETTPIELVLDDGSDSCHPIRMAIQRAIYRDDLHALYFHQRRAVFE